MQAGGAERGTCREVAAAFLKLGFTAFGGPAAHVALMEDEFVTRRKWVDRRHFLDLVSAVNFIPGPNSTEIAIHLGLIRAGFGGLLTAGVCFISPAVLIILLIAWAYVRYDSLPQVQHIMRGIGAAVVSVILHALWRLVRALPGEVGAWCIVMGALVAAVLLRDHPRAQPEILILLAGALIGAMRARTQSAATLPALLLLSGEHAESLRSLALFFLKVGGTLFGSGYVLVSYLQTGLVDERHWLTQRQLVDAISVGQFTPGPLLTTATFVGFVVGHDRFGGGVAGGVLTGIVATVAIFLPAFVLIALCAPILQRLRNAPAARGALDGMNAAVVGLIAAVGIRLGISSAMPNARELDFLAIAIMVVAFVVLLWRVNATWVILGAGLVGWMARTA